MPQTPAKRRPPRAVVEHNKIIVFDGVCRLCCASFRFIYRHDKADAFRFTTAQSGHGREILEWCTLPTEHYQTIVYIEYGVAFQRSDAMLRILRHLSWPWPLLSLARFCPKFVRDWCYDLVARNRYRLIGKRETCLIPNDDLASRFL